MCPPHQTAGSEGMSATSDKAKPRLKRSIVANTAMNGIAQFASLFSTLVFFPLLVSAFGAAEYGVYVIAASVAGFALLFDFGIGASTVRLVAHRASLEDADGLAMVIATSFALLLALGVVLGAAIALIGVVAGELFRVTPEQAGLLHTLLLISAASQLWYWPSSVSIHALSGLERYDIVARTSLGVTVANVGAVGLVLLFGWGPIGLMIAGTLVMIGASLVNLRALYRVKPCGPIAVAPSRSVAHDILRGGLPIFFAGVAGFLNREQADRLIVGIMIGPAGVTLYEVAAKLSMLVSQVTILATSAILPVASGYAARGDAAALKDLFLRGSRYISLAVAPIAVALLVLADPFISAWFGPGFSASVPVAQLLIFAQVFVPLYQIGDPILIGKGRFSLWLPRGLGLAALNVAVSAVFVSLIGLPGVAVGTVASGLLELPLYMPIVLAETGVTARAWIRNAGPAYLLLPVVVVVAWAAALTALGTTLVGVGVITALAVGVYWVAAYAVILTAPERAELWQRLGRLRPARAGDA